MLMLVFCKNVPRHFRRNVIVTLILPSRESEIKEAIATLAKTSKILKSPLNKLFTKKNTNHYFKQADKVSFPLLSILNIRERKSRWKNK